MSPRRLWRPVPRPRAGRDAPSRRRVDRAARGFALGVRDPQLALLLHRIDESPILPSRRFEIFTDGNLASAAMLAAIEGARTEVLLESYIFKDDSVGRLIVGALGRAVARGVQVRVIADALGSMQTREEFWRILEQLRIVFRLFHPLHWFGRWPWLHLFRDHRKILVIDREIAFTGGMNIGEEYGSGILTDHAPVDERRGDNRGSGPTERTWRDTHARVEGPTAWELAVVFRESWRRADGPDFELPSLREPESSEGTQTLVLDSRPGRGHRETALVLRALLAAARERVYITNAYFAPSLAALRALCRAAGRGVDVRLLLPGKSDISLLQSAARGSYSRLLKRGVRIFEYQPTVLHAKTMVIDGFAAVVGSSNLDFRSFVFNSECNLVALDESVGYRLQTAFEHDLARAQEIELGAWSRRPFGQRVKERLARLLSPLL